MNFKNVKSNSLVTEGVLLVKLPWKKNFLKIPQEIIFKAERLNNNRLVISCGKKVIKSDLEKGVYRHLGLELSQGKLMIEPLVVPNPKVGRYSNYNINGRSIPRYDLPKVVKTYSFDAPNFGDWSKGTHEVSWDREVYQREYWYPQDICIEVSVLEEDESSFVIKFALDTVVTKDDDNFMDKLLYHCNLLQENVGACDIFEAEAASESYIQTLHVDWELLPPGTKYVDNNIQHILGKFRNPNPNTEAEIRDRMAFFEQLKPLKYIAGENKFSQYFGAMFTDNLVVLENIRYGNAIYVFYEDWKSLSKLSRTEILNSKNIKFTRVLHTGNWKNKVVKALAEAPA